MLRAEVVFTGPTEQFLTLAGLWLAVVSEPDRSAARTYDHVAFAVDAADLRAFRDRAEAAGLEVADERPGRSLYLRLPEGQLVELHAGCLADRISSRA